AVHLFAGNLNWKGPCATIDTYTPRMPRTGHAKLPHRKATPPHRKKRFVCHWPEQQSLPTTVQHQWAGYLPICGDGNPETATGNGCSHAEQGPMQILRRSKPT